MFNRYIKERKNHHATESEFSPFIRVQARAVLQNQACPAGKAD